MMNCKKKYGGSIASDRINSMVTPETYINMNRQAQNLIGGKNTTNHKQKIGGSIASDKVVNIITPETFVRINRETQNLTGGKCSCKNKCSCKKGGNVSSIKHIRELFDQNNYKINNRIGGQKKVSFKKGDSKSNKPAVKNGSKITGQKKGGSKQNLEVGLDYSDIKLLGRPTPNVSREISPISNQIMADYQYGVQPSMNKVTEYGSVYDGKNNKFSYNQNLTGGKRKTK